jgi:hypothetical protein
MARKRKNETNANDESEQAAQASRNGAAADATAAETEESSGGGLGKLLFLLLIAGVLALVISKDMRSKVLDMLFGAEEEFDYSSTTMPATDAPVGAVS